MLLGESAVGKSSLVLRFVKGQFHEFQESTIGAAFLTQTVCLDDTTVKFEIWDTAGQERYHSLAPMYYRYVDLLHSAERSSLIVIFISICNICIGFFIFSPSYSISGVPKQPLLYTISQMLTRLPVLKHGYESFKDR